MKIISKYRSQFIETILLSTPIIGAFMLLPLVLFMKSMEFTEISALQNDGTILLSILTFTTLNILLFWGINLTLLTFFSKKEQQGNSKQKYYRYFLSFVILFMISIPLAILGKTVRPVDFKWFSWYPLVGVTAINSFILLMIDLIISQGEKAQLRVEKAQLEITQLATQQEQLKQQIHPHFLFNSLGTLRILIKKDPESADYYTGRLAKFLRTSLSLAQSDVIPIREELDFLENYFNLQKMRFLEGIQLKIDIPEKVITNGRIPVFSLQILAENAIKHNAFSTKAPVRLHIKFLAPNFLEISNNKAQKYTPEISTGIGLQNLTMRFKHFTEFAPQITETQEQFTVKIKILGI